MRVSFFIILACQLFFVNSEQQRLRRFRLNKESVELIEEIDYIILRQIWPASSCMFPGMHTCEIADNISSWVIHGLWPSSLKNKMGPNFCKKDMNFNFDLIKGLLPSLLEYWPNLYTNTPLESFWKHEWEKHGTCALGLPEIQDQKDYFNVSLSLRKKFDFGPILKEKQIVPDDTNLYSLEKMSESIFDHLRVKPMLVCYFLKESNVQYLSQMQVCLNKEYRLIDCGSETPQLLQTLKPHLFNNDNNNSSKLHSVHEMPCVSNVPVHYPTIKHKFF